MKSNKKIIKIESNPLYIALQPNKNNNQINTPNPRK